jgi:hypothetical protein
MRPWTEFFATFKPPEMNPEYVSQRVTTNLLHYRSNYIFICAMVFLLRIVFSPILLITLVICAGVAYYSFVVHSGPFRVGEVLLDQKMKSYITGGVCLVLLILTGSLEALLWGLLSSLLLCGLHAFFRPRNIASRANHAYEEMKMSWFGMGMASGGGSGSSGSHKKADGLSPDDPEAPPVTNVSGDSYVGGRGYSQSTFGANTPLTQQQLPQQQGDVRKRGAGPVKGVSGVAPMEPVPSSKYD